MKDFKGTPEPWFVSYRKDGWGVRVTNGVQSVVTFNGKRKKTDIDGMCELVAPKHADRKVFDAHLIAAAPDMLEALQIAREYVVQDIEFRKNAMKGYPLNWEIEESELAIIDAAIAKALGEDHD